jgi:hypothetical protein
VALVQRQTAPRRVVPDAGGGVQRSGSGDLAVVRRWAHGAAPCGRAAVGRSKAKRAGRFDAGGKKIKK